MPRLSANLIPTTTGFATITAGAFIVGTKYRILTVGTTDFVAIGAASDTIGVVFTATGVGSGTGTASVEIDGVKVKGDGYYGYSDGLHTIAHYLAGFVGVLEVQGALTNEPVDADWVTLDTRDGTSTPVTENATYNFTGNFVWIRAKVIRFTPRSLSASQSPTR